MSNETLKTVAMVKPLQWNSVGFAHTPFGLFYYLDHRRGDVPIVLEKREGSSTTKSFWRTEDEAKAAAQADYESRILSALVPAPQVQGCEPVAPTGQFIIREVGEIGDFYGVVLEGDIESVRSVGALFGEKVSLIPAPSPTGKP